MIRLSHLSFRHSSAALQLVRPHLLYDEAGIIQSSHVILERRWNPALWEQSLRSFSSGSNDSANIKRKAVEGVRASKIKDIDDANAATEDQAANTSLRQLFSYLRPEHARMQLAFCALLGSSSVTLAYPVMLGKMVDAFGAGTAATTTDSAAASSTPEILFPIVLEHVTLFSGIVILGGIATMARLYLIETAIERIQFRLRQRFFGALLTRPLSFFDRPGNSSGAMLGRLNNDITVTSRVLVDVSQGTRCIFSALVGTYMIVSQAPWEMLGNFALPVAALFGGGFVYGRLVRRIAAQRQARLANATEYAEERLSGLRTVRLFNREPSELKIFESKLDQVYDAGFRSALASAGSGAVIVSGGGLFLLSVCYNCGVLIQTGVLSLGSAVSLAMYCVMTGGAITGLASAYGEVQKALGACGKVAEVLEAQKSSLERSCDDLLTGVPAGYVFSEPSWNSIQSGNLEPRYINTSSESVESSLRVSFENINFSYPSRPDTPVLNDFSLDIPAGAKVAVLGRSGSGKSTIVQLLTGLYAPQQGRVLIESNGKQIDLFDETCIESRGRHGVWLRDRLGVILQDPLLFSMSIRRNIQYGRNQDTGCDTSDDLEIEDILQRAADTAYVTEFASSLPQGLDTLAGDRGNALSGGQRQRVCLARALARTPRMLIFDEATSALDLRSEALVHEALQRILTKTGNDVPNDISSDVTCLMITHRLSALPFVDRIAVMDEGRVVQYGLKEQVLHEPGEALKKILESSGELRYTS